MNSCYRLVPSPIRRKNLLFTFFQIATHKLLTAERRIQELESAERQLRLLCDGGKDDMAIDDLEKLESVVDKSKVVIAQRLAMARVKKEMEERSRCLVCMEKEREVAFIPCGHRACCQKCAGNLSVCPLCRARIDHRLRTFD